MAGANANKISPEEQRRQEQLLRDSEEYKRRQTQSGSQLKSLRAESKEQGFEETYRYKLKTPEQMAMESLNKKSNMGEAVTLTPEQYNQQLKKYELEYNEADRIIKNTSIFNTQEAEKARLENTANYSDSTIGRKRPKAGVYKYDADPYSFTVSNAQNRRTNTSQNTRNKYFDVLGSSWFGREETSRASRYNRDVAQRKRLISDEEVQSGAGQLDENIEDNKSSINRYGRKKGYTNRAMKSDNISVARSGLKI